MQNRYKSCADGLEQEIWLVLEQWSDVSVVRKCKRTAISLITAVWPAGYLAKNAIIWSFRRLFISATASFFAFFLNFLLLIHPATHTFTCSFTHCSTLFTQSSFLSFLIKRLFYCIHWTVKIIFVNCCFKFLTWLHRNYKLKLMLADEIDTTVNS